MSGNLSKYLVVFVGLMLAMAMIEPVSAQRGGGRGFSRLFGGIAKAQLATLDEVQAELKLNDEQKTQIEDINDELREDRRDLFGSNFGRIGDILPERDRLNREASAKVDELLDDGQRKRLQEIEIQVNGPNALDDPSVVEELRLTDEQKTKLAEVRAANTAAAEEAMGDFDEMSREERREKFRKLADTAGDKLLAVLSDEQKAQFETMKGKEIEIDPSSLFGRRRRGD